jgi:enamine deaminase RidA (YjgF/YER057c/UK114 family)
MDIQMIKPIVPSEWRIKYEKWHFSPAVECGNFIFVSGCTGTKPDETISKNIQEQFRQAFKNVETALIEAGLDFSSVVELTSYHVGLRDHFAEFITVKDEFIKEPYPAWTAIGVAELAADNAVLEIKVVAATE